VTLTGGDTAQPSFTAPTGPATLVFTVEVCDIFTACDTDSVTINVDAPVVNNDPTADAGPDQSVASGASVNLDGSASADADAGDTLTYAWTQTGGLSTVTLTGADTASPSFTAPTGPDSLTFQLEVCDQHAACNTDSVTITVDPPNNAPTADAGPDQTVASNAGVSLDGTGSTDPDADTLSYAWSQSSGPAVTLSGPLTATPSFTAPTGPATLTFQLEVCDPSNACDTDSVTVNVTAPITVADASIDAIINGPTKSRGSSKALVAKVTNLGTAPLTVCGTDVTWAITVNGTPTSGSVAVASGCKTLAPGASTRLKATWTYGGSEVTSGASVSYTAHVGVAGDVDAGNDSDTETATAK
jgi:hypothetical protein